jgi:CheY-like chemotaxis protein
VDAAGRLRCPACGRACQPLDRYCSECGGKLAQQEPAEPSDGAPLRADSVSGYETQATILPPHVTGVSASRPLPLPPRDHGFAPGSLFAGRYRIERLVGEGGMGRVYAATDESIDELVAIKVLAPAYAAEPAMLQQFKRELKLARRVRQRNVVQSFDLGFADGVSFISMEYVDAENLTAFLRRNGSLPEAEALGILRQVLKGLRAAHELGIVHRDIKAGNVLVNADRIAFITDFGLATPAALVPTLAAGTPEYMAPEQFRGEAVVPATDLYACGVLLHAMLMGGLPFQGRTQSEMRDAHLTLQPEPVPESVGSRETRELISDLLRKDPAERPKSAAEVLERVNAILALGSLTVRTTQPVALVVESDASVLWLCADALEKDGYHVLTADSARHGLRLAFENDPTVIVLDASVHGELDVPLDSAAAPSLNAGGSGVEGLGFCRVLAMDQKLKGVPVLVTAQTERPGLREAFGLIGAAGVLSPPFTAVRLSAGVRQAIGAAYDERPAS